MIDKHKNTQAETTAQATSTKRSRDTKAECRRSARATLISTQAASKSTHSYTQGIVAGKGIQANTQAVANA